MQNNQFTCSWNNLWEALLLTCCTTNWVCVHCAGHCRMLWICEHFAPTANNNSCINFMSPEIFLQVSFFKNYIAMQMTMKGYNTLLQNHTCALQVLKHKLSNILGQRDNLTTLRLNLPMSNAPEIHSLTDQRKVYSDWWENMLCEYVKADYPNWMISVQFLEPCTLQNLWLCNNTFIWFHKITYNLYI